VKFCSRYAGHSPLTALLCPVVMGVDAPLIAPVLREHLPEHLQQSVVRLGDGCEPPYTFELLPGDGPPPRAVAGIHDVQTDRTVARVVRHIDRHGLNLLKRRAKPRREVVDAAQAAPAFFTEEQVLLDAGQVWFG
jgi:hypothetical protein